MKSLPKSQILRFTEKAIHLARRAVSRYSSNFSKHRYTLPQHVVLLCLKVRKNTTYQLSAPGLGGLLVVIGLCVILILTRSSSEFRPVFRKSA